MNNVEQNGAVNHNSKYSFWKLISERFIEIPIIQRDYAQGRTSSNVSQIRVDLLDSIYHSLMEDRPLDFDFVYGTEDGEKLFPLDGQQRLTTLFLLHWYLAEKEGKMTYAREFLRDFSYSTRTSSREFCELLVDLDYEPHDKIAVSTCVKNENGYFMTWDNDPTIRAMLVMLDAIHKKFYHCPPLFEKLIREERPLITFNFLSMGEYRLTDDLYIKMNARGKALTPFENFKALFIQHLRKHKLPYTHFENSIDGNWTDLLWDYRSYDNTIDEEYMNLFCFCSEMIYLITEPNPDQEEPFPNGSIRELVEFYDTEEKVNLLYSLLDLWPSKDAAAACLKGLLTVSHEEDKVQLFDGTVDLFSALIDGRSLTVQQRVLLFSIMYKLILSGIGTDRPALLDYIRIVRNFIINTRQFVKERCEYGPDFRLIRHGQPFMRFFAYKLAPCKNPYELIRGEYLPDYKGVNASTYQQESIKADIIIKKPEYKKLIQGLEDLDVFRSSIFNILDFAVEHGSESLVEDIANLFTPEYSNLIIRAMLSIKDYGIELSTTLIGPRVFYGNKDKWYHILTQETGKGYPAFITEFIRQYLATEASYIEDALQEMIDNNLPAVSKNDWRYCIIKYPSTLEEKHEIQNRNLVFAKEITAKRTIAHRMNGRRLNAFHIIPEYFEVEKQLDGKCSAFLCGQNAEDFGKVSFIGMDGLAICLDIDEGIKILRSRKAEYNRLIPAAEEAFAAIDRSDMDRVEQMVLLSNIICSI